MKYSLKWLYEIDENKSPTGVKPKSASSGISSLDWLNNIDEGKESIIEMQPQRRGPIPSVTEQWESVKKDLPKKPPQEEYFPEPTLPRKAAELAIQMGSGVEQAARGVQDVGMGLLSFPAWLAGFASRYGEEALSPLFRRDIDTSTTFPEYIPEEVGEGKYKATPSHKLIEEARARGDRWQSPFMSKGPAEPTIIEQIAQREGVRLDPEGPAKTYEAIVKPVEKVMEHLPSRYIEEEILPHHPNLGAWTGLGADLYLFGKVHKEGGKAVRRARRIGSFIKEYGPIMDMSVKTYLQEAKKAYAKDLGFDKVAGILKRRVKKKKTNPRSSLKDAFLDELKDVKEGDPRFERLTNEVEALRRAEQGYLAVKPDDPRAIRLDKELENLRQSELADIKAESERRGPISSDYYHEIRELEPTNLQEILGESAFRKYYGDTGTSKLFVDLLTGNRAQKKVAKEILLSRGFTKDHITSENYAKRMAGIEKWYDTVRDFINEEIIHKYAFSDRDIKEIKRKIRKDREETKARIAEKYDKDEPAPIKMTSESEAKLDAWFEQLERDIDNISRDTSTESEGRIPPQAQRIMDLARKSSEQVRAKHFIEGLARRAEAKLRKEEIKKEAFKGKRKEQKEAELRKIRTKLRKILAEKDKESARELVKQILNRENIKEMPDQAKWLLNVAEFVSEKTRTKHTIESLVRQAERKAKKESIKEENFRKERATKIESELREIRSKLRKILKEREKESSKDLVSQTLKRGGVKEVPPAAQRLTDLARAKSKSRGIYRDYSKAHESAEKIKEAQLRQQQPDTRSVGPKSQPYFMRRKSIVRDRSKEEQAVLEHLEDLQRRITERGDLEYVQEIEYLKRLLLEIKEDPGDVWAQTLALSRRGGKARQVRLTEQRSENLPPRVAVEGRESKPNLENKMLSRSKKEKGGEEVAPRVREEVKESRPEEGVEGERTGEVRLRDTEREGLETKTKGKEEKLDLETAPSEVKTLYETAYNYALDEGFHDVIRDNAGKDASTVRRKVDWWADANDVRLNEKMVDVAITAFDAKEGLRIKRVYRPELEYISAASSVPSANINIPTIKLTKEQQRLFREGKLSKKDLDKIAEEQIAETIADRVMEHETIKAAYDLKEEFDWIAEFREELPSNQRGYDPVKEVMKAREKRKELRLPKNYGERSLKGDFADPHEYAKWLLGEQRKEVIRKAGPREYDKLYEDGGAEAVAQAFLKNELIYIPGVSELIESLRQSRRTGKPKFTSDDIEIFAAIKDKAERLGIRPEETLRTIFTFTPEEKVKLMNDFREWKKYEDLGGPAKRAELKNAVNVDDTQRAEVRNATDGIVELAKKDKNFQYFVDKLRENRVIVDSYEKGTTIPPQRALTLRDDRPVNYVQPKHEPFKIWSPHIFWKSYTDYRSNPGLLHTIADSIYDFNVVESNKWLRDLKKEIPSSKEMIIRDMGETYTKLGELREEKFKILEEQKAANRELVRHDLLTQRHKDAKKRLERIKGELEENANAARELLLPTLEKYLPKWLEESPSVRIFSWIADKIPGSKLSKRELELATNIKKYFTDTRKDRIGLGLTVKGTDYVPNIILDTMNFLEGDRFLDILKPNQKRVNFLLKAQARTTDALLFPDIITALETYIPMAERQLAYEPVMQRFGPDFRRQLSRKAREYWNEWQESNFFRKPATIFERGVNAAVNFEYLALIALSTSVAFKHLLKLGGTAATHSWFTVLPEGIARAAKIPVQAMMERFGIKGKHNELRLYRSYVRSGELIRALDEMRIPNRGVMHFVKKWSATPVRMIESIDNGINVMAGAVAATHKGMSWKDAYLAIWETVLDVNFRGRSDQPLWQKGSLMRALTMFQMTPFKLLEFKKELFRGGLSGKDAFGTTNGTRLMRYLVLIGATEMIARANDTSLLEMWAHLPFMHGSIKGDKDYFIKPHVPELSGSPLAQRVVESGFAGGPKTPLARKWFGPMNHGNILVGLTNMLTDWPSMRRINRTLLQRSHSTWYDSSLKDLLGLKNWQAIEGTLHNSRRRKRGRSNRRRRRR